MGQNWLKKSYASQKDIKLPMTQSRVAQIPVIWSYPPDWWISKRLFISFWDALDFTYPVVIGLSANIIKSVSNCLRVKSINFDNFKVVCHLVFNLKISNFKKINFFYSSRRFWFFFSVFKIFLCSVYGTGTTHSGTFYRKWICIGVSTLKILLVWICFVVAGHEQC